MFSPNTVFVVGAGASFEVNFPLGSGLKERVRELVYCEPNQGFQNEAIRRAVAQIAGNRQHLWSNFGHAAERIRDGLSHVMSIDTFLDMHRDNHAVVQLGKIAICVAIVEAERNSALKAVFDTRDIAKQTLPPLEKQYGESWYVPFGELLTQGVALDQVESIYDNVSVITFNYDRGIELFAEHLIRRAYGLGDRSREVAKRLEILHVYGKIAPFYSDDGKGQLPFGRNEGAPYVELAENIRTYTETVDSDVDDRIKQRIRQAETLVFLGFGWLPQNMQLFSVNESFATRVFFTTKGIAEPDRNTVRADISAALKIEASDFDYGDRTYRPFEERGGCADLFRNHWRQLTRA